MTLACWRCDNEDIEFPKGIGTWRCPGCGERGVYARPALCKSDGSAKNIPYEVMNNPPKGATLFGSIAVPFRARTEN